MRTYWYGEDKMVRVFLSEVFQPPPAGARVQDFLTAVAASLGFPVLLDWSNKIEDEGDEVLVYAPHDPSATPEVPGREDLNAESLVVWMRRGTMAGLFFVKTLVDLVTILSMIASYQKALCEITEYQERFTELRVQHARNAVYVAGDSVLRR